MNAKPKYTKPMDWYSWRATNRRRLSKGLSITLLVALLAGLIPPPLVYTVLPPTVAELAATALPAPPVLSAASLAQASNTSVLTITKSVVGSANTGPYNIAITGPGGYNNNTTVSVGSPRVLTGLASGLYTVTENSPGPGWDTTYTVNAAPATAGPAVINLSHPYTTPFLASSNIALGRPATQSADYQASTSASLAVDGNTDGALGNGSVAVANVAANAWWQMDLGASYNLSTIVLWSRTDGFHGQTGNVSVFVSDTPFTSTNYNTTLAQPGVSNYPLVTAVAGSNPLTVNRSGRYVRVQHTNTDYLSLAEVQIFAQAISGLVYRDFNSDGQFTSNTTSKEVGLAGVTVTAYDKTGAVVGSTTSSANGSYAIPVSMIGPYRVEFSNLPAGYEPSRRGSGNGTSVQFINAPGSNLNAGFNHPADYSQANPYLFVPQFWNGSASGSTALSRFRYDLTGEQGVATDTQLGSAWGLAYARTSKTLYATAFLKRHTGLGPGGLGAIYGLANANGASVGAPTVFATVPNVGTVLSNAARGVNVTGDTPNTDASTFDQIGKVGLGDIDISDDESTLWTVNLNTRELVQIPITSPSNQTTYAIPLNTCGEITDGVGSALRINVAGNGFTDSGTPSRTWLTDTAFIGGALQQTGNTITNINNPGDGTGTSSQPLYQGMRYGSAFAYSLQLPNGAYTVRLHFADVAGAFNRAFSVKANGTTMLTGINPYGLAGNQVNRAVLQTFNTNILTGTLRLDFVDEPGGDGNAILSGIEVTAQAGNMPTGEFRPFATKYYRDKVYVGGVCTAEYSQERVDLKAMVYQFDPVGGTFSPVLTFPLNYAKGVAQWFCNNGNITQRWNPWIASYVDSAKSSCDEGTQVYPSPILADLEFDVDGSLILGLLDRFGPQTGWANRFPDGTTTENGVTGGDVLRAGYINGAYQLENNGQVNSTLFGPLTGTAGNNQGPGGGEFYNFDYARSWSDHQETSLGGLALLPGSQRLVMSAMDPDGVWVGGVTWGSNVNGAQLNWLVLQDNAVGGLRKGGSQGDVEILSDPAPLEIGNRVWDDFNGDGIQDAGEPGLNGITVSRQSPTNTVTTVTSGDGNYYFAVSPNTPYTLTVVPPSGYSVTLTDASALSGATVTSNHAISDTRDSDAALVAGVARILYTTGSAGQNNHGLDFGFTRPATAQVTITNTAPGAIQVSKQVTTTDGSNPTVGGSFTINVNCGNVTPSPSNSQTVAAGGSVTFSNIPAGSTCAISENTSNLPAAPSGYAWLLHQVTPDQVTISAGQTRAVTVRNTLAARPPASGVLTVTKTLSGTWPGAFNINVAGPNGYLTTTTVSPGSPRVLTGLTPGVYTVTESLPSGGWTTTYTATPGTGGSSQSVVNLFSTISAAAVNPAAITGRVFNDYESDGILDTSGTIIDTGVPSMTVKAYDRNGNAVGSATTNSTGNYSLTPTASGPWRLELSNLPAGYEPSRNGTDNGSSIRFVSTSGASNVNFGVLKPCDYCQTSPQLELTEMTYGDPMQSPPSTQAALLRFNYDAPGALTTDATIAQIGATWGLAYARANRLLFVSAFQRRFTGYGPLGTGGIYYFNRNTNTLVNWLNLNTLAGINTGADPHTTLPAVGGATPVRDPGSYDAVGKISLGDLEISTNEQTLWVVNLNQRTLLEIPLTGNPPVAPTAITTHDLSNAVNCTNGVFRPWATKFYNDKIYVGGVCSGENGGTQSNLTAHVLVHDPLGAVGSFSQVFSMPLNYAKGCSLNFGGLIDCNGWNVWQTNWPSSFDAGGGGYTAKTQPILSDIEFDVDGSMILGFTDRWGYQTGNANYQPNSPDTALYSGTTGGDLLRVCLVGGSYVAEGGAGCPKLNNDNIPSAPQKTEFYQDAGGGGLHPEAALGALALLPGRGEVVSTKLDPQSVFAVGVYWVNNTTGVIRQEFNTMGNPYNKASSIGDIELLCNPAPLEIGNRVWNDINGNGVQDPGEPGLNGITVSRQSVTNTLTTVTSGDGNYYFAVSPNTAYTLTVTPPNDYNVTQLNAQALAGAAVTSNHPISDTRDSDAVFMAGKATIFYTTGSAGQNNHGLDFGFTQPVTGRAGIFNVPPPYSYALRKELRTPDPMRIGEDITFTIRITNTGVTTITTMPVRDLYNLRAMTFDHANVAPDDPADDGQLDWSDLTTSLGRDLGPSQSFVLHTVFVARNDTGVLPDGVTINTAQVLLALSKTVTATVRIEASTAVALASHSARYDLNNGVTLDWTTANESEIAGFHLLRRELGSGGGWVRLNTDLILAQQPGQASGASYTFADPGVQFGKSYLYLIELVDASGATSRAELGLVIAGSRVLLPLVAR